MSAKRRSAARARAPDMDNVGAAIAQLPPQPPGGWQSPTAGRRQRQCSRCQRIANKPRADRGRAAEARRHETRCYRVDQDGPPAARSAAPPPHAPTTARDERIRVVVPVALRAMIGLTSFAEFVIRHSCFVIRSFHSWCPSSCVLKRRHVRQIAIAVVIVQPVADDKLVGNLETPRGPAPSTPPCGRAFARAPSIAAMPD